MLNAVAQLLALPERVWFTSVMAATETPTEQCTNCDAPATTAAYGEPFCGDCLCSSCDHVHEDDTCPAVEAEPYDRSR